MSKDDAALPSMLIAGILALSAIMVGFVVTLMLFAGTVGKPELLALEELKRHVNRVKYLLSSQMTTLVFALALSVFSTIWLVAYISKADHLIQGAVGAVTGGLLSISVMRTLLLPFQIYELHSATFIDLLKSAANETRKHYGH